MYSIADLETFVAVARRGGITAAARQLALSAATVSQRIAKLEATLGVTLFHRDSRHVAPSEAGRRFLERVEGILADLRQAEIDAGADDQDLRGRLRATMSPWILSRFVLPALAPFRRRHPALSIEFLAVDRYVPLAEEGQDCAIRVGLLADSAMIAKKLCDNQRVICAAPSLLEALGAPRSVADLEAAPWVCLPWQAQLDVRDEDGARRRITLPRDVVVSNSDALTQAAISGLGLAVKSRLAVKTELDAGLLAEAAPGALDPADAPIWFLHPPSGRVNRHVAAFGRLAQDAFRHV